MYTLLKNGLRYKKIEYQQSWEIQSICIAFYTKITKFSHYVSKSYICKVIFVFEYQKYFIFIKS